jgi:ankyrin repeat protein
MSDVAAQIAALKKQAVELKQAGKIGEAVAVLRQFRALETKQRGEVLFASSVKGDIEAVEKALQPSAAEIINLTHKGGYTALHAASRNGFVKVVNALVLAGANVKITTEFGKHALELATKQGHREVISFLQPLYPEELAAAAKKKKEAEALARTIAQAVAEAAKEVAEEEKANPSPGMQLPPEMMNMLSFGDDDEAGS